MALLNRFSKLNDRAETGIFTFIVTKSVTRDFHRDATTKDFCFGYHRWAISFQRPTEKVLGVHLLLRNPSPNTACVVDFTLSLLNRQHFSQNEVYTKRQAKFTITNPMQGVSRWIQMSDLIDKHFSNETGEFLFELTLSNMTTIFECDIQLNPTILTQYKGMLKGGPAPTSGPPASQQQQIAGRTGRSGSELINLETNYFTFGAFEWSLTVVPLVVAVGRPSSVSSHLQQQQQQQQECSSNSSSSSNTNSNLLATSSKSLEKQLKKQQQAAGSQQPAPQPAAQNLEPVCRVYLNRLNGSDSLCRVKYRVILGHHQPGGQQSAEFVDSKVLDQISDSSGHIRGYQFKNSNVLKLISLKPNSAASSAGGGQHLGSGHASKHPPSNAGQPAASLDLRVHIEMFCANTISECRVQMDRKQQHQHHQQQQAQNETQVSNCLDRNKQAWCVEADCEASENVRLKLFFMELQSVPRNHIRYISWIAYIVRRDTKTGALRESTAVKNSPHCNYYLQDGMDMGTIMNTDISLKELNNLPSYLESGHLTVHIEWVDSLLLFSHLYSNYDALAIIQRHQIGRELDALQTAFMRLETKYNDLLKSAGRLGSHRGALESGAEEEEEEDEEDVDEEEEEEAAEEEADGEEEDYSLGEERSRASSASLIELQQQAQYAGQPAASVGGRKRQSGPNQEDILGGQRKPLASAAFAMSHDERLKFSSSTPPGGLMVQPPASQQQAGQPQAQPQTGQLRRRQLPLEPIEFKQQALQQAAHELRRNSQASYQQIRATSAAATFELAGNYDHRQLHHLQQQTGSLRKQFTTPGGSINMAEARRRSQPQQQAAHCLAAESAAGPELARLPASQLNQPEASQVLEQLPAGLAFQAHSVVNTNAITQHQAPNFLYQQAQPNYPQISHDEGYSANTQQMATISYNSNLQQEQLFRHSGPLEQVEQDKQVFQGPSSMIVAAEQEPPDIAAEMEALYLVGQGNAQLSAGSTGRFNLEHFYDDHQRRQQLIHQNRPVSQSVRRDSSQDYAVPIQSLKGTSRGSRPSFSELMLNSRLGTCQFPIPRNRNLSMSGVDQQFEHFGGGQL